MDRMYDRYECVSLLIVEFVNPLSESVECNALSWFEKNLLLLLLYIKVHQEARKANKYRHNFF